MGNSMLSPNGNKHDTPPKTSGKNANIKKNGNLSIDKSILKQHIIGAKRNSFDCSSPLHFPRSESQVRVCSDIDSIKEELELKQDDIKDENTNNHHIIDQLLQFGFGKKDITSTMNELSGGSGSLSLDINVVLESMEQKQTLRQYHTLSKFIDKNTMPNV